MNQPLIKWTGSKRPIANKIIQYFPNEIDTYYEPFLGGGSVLFELLRSDKVVNSFNCSDLNNNLIQIYNCVKDDPYKLIDGYAHHWNKLQTTPNYYYDARAEYNANKDFIIFYFLTRTCYNGTIRYNLKGEFNTSHHFGRTGMLPHKIKNIILEYHALMKDKDITFTCSSFNDVVVKSNSVVYLDPPYTNTASLYQGNISLDLLIEWISKLDSNWYMNMNGVNSNDNELQFPFKCNKVLLKSGNSSFSRLKGNNVIVDEYFYWNTDTK